MKTRVETWGLGSGDDTGDLGVGSKVNTGG